MTRVDESRELGDWAQCAFFPNPENCRRLAAARLKEHHEDWITGRRYIDMSRRRDDILDPPEEPESVSPAA